MNYEFAIVDVPPVTLAVCETFTSQADIPIRIRKLFDIVYDWLSQSSVKQVGNNYAIYDQFAPDGLRMRVGFPVSASFESTRLVQCLDLGSYTGLPMAHSKLNEWCVSQSLNRGELSWEQYGDWHDDQSKLVTDVYIKLV